MKSWLAILWLATWPPPPLSSGLRHDPSSSCRTLPHLVPVHTDDYCRSPECQNRIDPVPEGLYLCAVIKPLYRFIRDQDYESVDGKFVRQERDHDLIIGYDDINQLFWYPEGIARIVLTDKVRQPFLTWLITADLTPSDSSCRYSTGTTFHAFWPHQLEPSIFQDVLREAVVWAFAR